ncbi:glycosyltransferase family protein [Wenyingzhuangia marina]|uniref:Glycosyltransferase involved in cell wall bisynthesis n=1 Tax=Wenyingzhuangia marina TaxID=1195760 RepID=A0A1M5UAC4_9FLAO|nr:hypothetical protein [Wenyingzhuangia marina]GGF68781.1 hypothetical protein GCM10011397_09700 [Wenyingzhuangia marina]SHH59796.1 Glycosyltransferase involved in cell wall bisynthesis [Wenyingzhuangia marina]
MKILVIAQDLRISGTSEGVVSRSFIAKLADLYPESTVDLVYLKHVNSDDRLDLLPVDNIVEERINIFKFPKYVLWPNKIYWRIFHKTLKEQFIFSKYKKHLSKIDYKKYDLIFIRSCGQEYEVIRAAKNLPILKNAIINFHDPFPVLWDSGSKLELNKLEVYKMMDMWEVVKQAKACISPSGLLSNDMEHLYGSNKKFFTVPHQFSPKVFDYSNVDNYRKKEKKISVSYHGAIQFKRNIDVLLDAYINIIDEDKFLKDNTEFVLRIKGDQTERIKEKYKNIKNIVILNTINFVNSSYEQKNESDIIVILENCDNTSHSNILVGKAPFLESLKKPIISISPKRSETRNIIKEEFIATYDNHDEIKNKLRYLIHLKMNNKNLNVSPFGDYFSLKSFRGSIESL